MHLNAAAPFTLAALFLLTGSTAAQKPTVKCPSGQYTLIGASNRPVTRNCEGGGTLASPSPLGTPSAASSLEECVETCKAQAGCVSFGYSARAGMCYLYNKRLIDMKYQQRTVNKGTVFSNQLCYSCKPLACTNVEAVENGGFETAGGDGSAANWVQPPDAEAGMTRQQDEVHGGAWSMKADFPTSGSPPASIQQVLSCVNPGLEYELTAWYYNTQTVFAIRLDGIQVFKGEGIAPDADGFELANVTVTPTTTSPTLTITFQQLNSAFAFVDDVSMRLKTPTS